MRTDPEEAASESTRRMAATLARRAVLSDEIAEPHPWSRRAAVGLAGVRVVLGVAALAIPETSGCAWIGNGTKGRDRAVLVRALGGRDVALGAGALLAMRKGRDVRRWLLMGAASDLVDTLATLAGFTELPKPRRWLVLAASGGAGLAGAVIAASLTTPLS